MTFNPTLELTNEMINEGFAFGCNMDDDGYLEYQDCMIQTFYPDIDLNAVKVMTNWAKFPTLNLITLDDLKDIEISALKKAVKQKQSDDLNIRIQAIHSSDAFRSCRDSYAVFPYVISCDSKISWHNLSTICSSCDNGNLGFESNQFEAPAVIYTCRFVNIIQSIWRADMDICAGLANNYIDEYPCGESIILKREITELQAEVDHLKQKNAELQYQVQLNTYSINMIQPANPVYDYQEIKSRKQKLHCEFKRLSKLMKLG